MYSRLKPQLKTFCIHSRLKQGSSRTSCLFRFVGQNHCDLHNSIHELQRQTGGLFQKRTPECGVLVQKETRIERPGGALTLRFTCAGKHMCFLLRRVSERTVVDTGHVVLALTRLRDFLAEWGIEEISIPVYHPNRSKLKPRELFAVLHVVFAESEITQHLHKKYFLSIA